MSRIFEEYPGGYTLEVATRTPNGEVNWRRMQLEGVIDPDEAIQLILSIARHAGIEVIPKVQIVLDAL